MLADINANAKRGKNAAPISPMALEAVKRIDGLFDIEREINGLTADQRLERRRKESLPLVDSLQAGFKTSGQNCRAVLRSPRRSITCSSVGMASRHSWRMAGFASRTTPRSAALRGFALGRKSWLFAGSDRGGSCSLHGHVDHDGKAQRHRSAGVAGRRSCPHR
uniref:Transposase n=1 Tax=Agrobacterium tumefaciens TaxID=358 RepID=Q52600_AGRTU|nr:unknown [Agrobacterium tumefaciens]